MHTLGAYFEFKAFCPELSIGLGVPRKTIRLIRSESEVRCVESNDVSKDYTDRMKGCADEQLPWQRRLCGYILKKDSPSCGMERVKIWDEKMPSRDGVGIYAARLMESLPFCRLKRRAGWVTRFSEKTSFSGYSSSGAGTT